MAVAARELNPVAAGTGDVVSTNNLSDLSNTATAAHNLGLGTADSPQFTAVNVGHATDTTLSRVSAGVLAVEGVTLATKTGAGAAVESIIIAVGDETTAITTGTAKVTFRMPYAFTLTAIRGSLTTADSSGASKLTIDVNESGTSVISTKLTFDATESTTTTAAVPCVISDSSLADDAAITVDVDSLGTGADAKGLKITLIGYKT